MTDNLSIDDLYDALLLVSGVPPSSLDHLQPCSVSDIGLLSAYAEKVRELQKALNAKLDQDVVSFLRRRNSTTPVMRLPPEVLLRIFECALGWPPQVDYYNVKSKLMRVCFHWFTLGRDAPSLSIFIHNRQSQTSFRKNLRKSGGALLALNFYQTRSKFGWLTLAMMLVGQVNRLRRACIDLNDTTPSDPDFTAFFESEASALEGLILKSAYRREVHLAVFFKATPRLRELVLENISLVWSHPSLRNLTHVEVRDVKRQGATVEDIVTIIAHSPCLTFISFTRFRIIPATSYTPQRYSLPSLTTLALFEVDTKSIEQIIRTVYAPCCRTLSLASEDRAPFDLALFKSWPGWLMDQLAGIIAQGAELRITFRDNSADIIADALPLDQSPSRARFSISLSFTSYMEIIDIFRELRYGSTTYTRLNLLQTFDVNQDGFFSSVEALPPLRSIKLETLNGHTGLSPATLQFFATAQPTSNEDFTNVFPFPALQSMDFVRSSTKATDLLDMLCLRYAGPKQNLTLGIHGEGLIGMTDNILGQLKKILGEDKVTWNRTIQRTVGGGVLVGILEEMSDDEAYANIHPPGVVTVDEQLDDSWLPW